MAHGKGAVSKPEFRAEMTDGTYCCGAMEIGKFTKAFKQDYNPTYGPFLWDSEWKKEKREPIAWHGITDHTQKEAEKSLKKMGFKVVGRWLNDSGNLLKFWLYVPKIKKNRRKK